MIIFKVKVITKVTQIQLFQFFRFGKSQKDLEKEFTNNASQKDNEKGKTTATCIVLQLISRSTKSWNVVRPFLGVIIKMIKIF